MSKSLLLGFSLLTLVSASVRADLMLVVNTTPADPSSGNVLAFDSASGGVVGSPPFLPAGGNGLAVPSALAQGADGSIAVASASDSSIRRFDPKGNFLGVLVPGGSGGLLDPSAMIFAPDGSLYVASRGSSSILEYDGTTGAFLRTVVAAGAGGLANPSDLAIRSDVLYVSSGTGSDVLAFRLDSGSFLSEVVAAGSGGLSDATALGFSASGNLVVASGNTGSILQFDGTTGAFLGTLVVPGAGGLGRPEDLAFASDGSLLVADSENRQILRFDGLTGSSGGPPLVTQGTAGLDTPSRILLVPASVPEPPALAMLLIGIMTVGAWSRSQLRTKVEASETGRFDNLLSTKQLDDDEVHPKIGRDCTRDAGPAGDPKPDRVLPDVHHTRRLSIPHDLLEPDHREPGTRLARGPTGLRDPVCVVLVSALFLHPPQGT